MVPPDSLVSAQDVLQAFRRDAPDLFLGAAFTAVGLVAIAFSALSKKRDALLIYFGIFAALYGLRLWIQPRLFGIALGHPTQFQISHAEFYKRLRFGISYLVPIPLVLYFRCAGFLITRVAAAAAYLLVIIESALTVAAFAFGPRPFYEVVNNIAVIAGLAILMLQFITTAQPLDKHIVVIRRGVLIFAGFAVWENINGIYFHFGRLEPVGFAIFLICLAYVAARRMLDRDRRLNDTQKELELAKRIQLSILPARFPPSPQFDVAARYVPMTSVAGDLYDYVLAEDGRAGLLIADVSGHGVPAALIASMVKLAAASQRAAASDPARFLLGMNAALRGNTQNQFVTAAYVYLDSAVRQIRYSAAGHPPMLVLRHRDVTAIEQNGLMLGAFDFSTYSATTLGLEDGDRLLLYTDGLIEASNAAGEFFGRESLATALASTVGSSPAEAADLILSSVQKWSATQDDDLTLVVCDFTA
jgi:sigma-B regulation protein RsbU (phosphoserine phosphatase)